MATAQIIGQTLKVLKNQDDYLQDGSSLVSPYLNDMNMNMNIEDRIEASFFDFDKGDANKSFFSLLKSVYKGKQDIVVTASSDLIDTSKTEVLFNDDGTFSIYNEDFEKLAKEEVAEILFHYRVDNGKGKGSFSVREVTVEVTGTNEAPKVETALISETDEDQIPYTINLLEGATDIDNGAVLHIGAVSESEEQGGWTVTDNVITIDPNYFNELNDGEFGQLNFSYQVIDEYGAYVDQTLTVDVKGITDAPSIELETSAGENVNEIRLQVTSEPANTERVMLSFVNLSTGAIVLDHLLNDVTAGVADYVSSYGINETFTLVLPKDSDFDGEITAMVTGIRDSDNYIYGSNEQAVDISYDVDSSIEDLSFYSNNQNMWGEFSGYIGWHEYVPFLGDAPIIWNEETQSWDNDFTAEYWRSGEFDIVDVDINSQDILAIIQGIADDIFAVAQAAFDTTAYVIDGVVQSTFDAAQTALDTAKTLFDNTAYAVDSAAKDIYDAAHYAFYTVATGVRDAAHTADLFNVLTDEINATYDVARGIWNEAKSVYDGVKKGIYDAANEIYQGSVALFNTAKDEYEDAKQAVLDTAQGVLDGVQAEINGILNLAGEIKFDSQLQVDADLFAQVGLQVDFELDMGSVETDVDYQLTSLTQYNQTTDMLAITPMMTNMTDGESVAFSTISPNATFYAALLYDVGADVGIYADSNLIVAETTIFDLPALDIDTTLGTNTWNDMLATVPESYRPDFFDDIEVGEFVLIDFDSTEGGPYEVPFIEQLTEDILSIELNLPTIETEGTADTFDMNYYDEGGLISFNFNEITDSILNLVNAELDFGEEYKEMYDLPSLGDSTTFYELVASMTSGFMNQLWDIIDDGQAEGMPILVLDATDETSTSLLHYNTWNFNTDKLFTDPTYDYTSDINDDTGSMGFYTAYGESDPILKVNIDIDAAVALIVNEVVKAIAIAASAGTAAAIKAIPTINPLNLEFGIEQVLKMSEVPEAEAKAITDYVTLGVGFEMADIDAYAAANFSQEFTLSIDDMAYTITMEDGVSYDFTANGAGDLLIENASIHDANGDGVIDYSLSIVPDAMFSNDTEIGMSVGYILDFLKAEFKAGVKLPLAELLGIENPGDAWPDIELNGIDVAVGPLLEIKGDFDVIDFDVYEARFDMDVGSVEDIELTGIGIDDDTMFVA